MLDSTRVRWRQLKQNVGAMRVKLFVTALTSLAVESTFSSQLWAEMRRGGLWRSVLNLRDNNKKLTTRKRKKKIFLKKSKIRKFINFNNWNQKHFISWILKCFRVALYCNLCLYFLSGWLGRARQTECDTQHWEITTKRRKSKEKIRKNEVQTKIKYQKWLKRNSSGSELDQGSQRLSLSQSSGKYQQKWLQRRTTWEKSTNMLQTKSGA